MKVTIKSFDVEMELKNKGIELEIRDAGGDFLGDLIVTKPKSSGAGARLLARTATA